VIKIPRYDKYDPISGGFRAISAIAWVTADVGKVWAVGMDAAGKIVKGAGASGIVGVTVVNGAKAIGEILDVMTHGEIVDFLLQAGTAAAAGTRYYGIAASGDFATTATGTPLGYTVEATRLIVRCNRTVALVTT
jgi:hypothetical protein